MGTFLAAYLVHGFRVALAALTMVLLGVVLWLLFGIGSATIGLRTPVLVFAFAAATFAAGGFVSARYITPGSVIHPVIAAVAVAVLCIAMWSAGDVSPLYVGVPVVAGVIAAIGAAAARVVGAPPNNRWRGP